MQHFNSCCWNCREYYTPSKTEEVPRKNSNHGSGILFGGTVLVRRGKFGAGCVEFLQRVINPIWSRCRVHSRQTVRTVQSLLPFVRRGTCPEVNSRGITYFCRKSAKPTMPLYCSQTFLAFWLQDCAPATVLLLVRCDRNNWSFADLLAVLYSERKEARLVHLAPVAHGRHHDYRTPLPRHDEPIR